MLGTPLSDGGGGGRPLLHRQQSRYSDDTPLSTPLSGLSINQKPKFFIPESANGTGINVLMIGTGEYTTGYIDNAQSETDKGAGVVALTMFDLRRRGKTNRLALCGVNGKKFPKIREHMKKSISQVYEGLDISTESFPLDTVINPKAYLEALDSFDRGDAVIIFTPDDTHFEIALEAVNRGLHVLVTKPLVKTLDEHRRLHEAAVANNVLVITEVHKRFDPIYIDARDKLKSLGAFSYLYAYMSQPKYQLETFKAWAGKSSDISYYLNSHHIDFHEWCVGDTARPISVTATASTGVAKKLFNIDCEDTITLTVCWEILNPSKQSASGAPCSMLSATAVYTSSWVAPKADVHSQQRFFCMNERGEVTVDQAHRGYTVSTDAVGFKSVNPLFMKYTPTDSRFSGQQGYGYRSLEAFIDAVNSVENEGKPVRFYNTNDTGLATIANTYRTTAILEAGRRSLDQKKTIEILYANPSTPCEPTGLK